MLCFHFALLCFALLCFALLACLFYKSILLTTNCNGQPGYKAAPILAVIVSACIKPIDTDASARDFAVSTSHVKFIYMNGEAFYQQQRFGFLSM